MNNQINQIVAYTNYEGLSQFHIFIKKFISKSNEFFSNETDLRVW